MTAIAKQLDNTIYPVPLETTPTRVFWGCHDSPLGPIMLGISDKGLCKMDLSSGYVTLYDLSCWKDEWPDTQFLPDSSKTAPFACRISQMSPQNISPATMAMYGTSFQLSILRAMLQLPEGQSMSYAEVIKLVEKPKAA